MPRGSSRASLRTPRRLLTLAAYATVIVGAMPRTAVCAWESEHGWADEHAVPDPFGDVKSVVITAAPADGATVATLPATTTTAAYAASAAGRRSERRDA